MTSIHMPRLRTASRNGAAMPNGSVSGASASGQKPVSRSAGLARAQDDVLEIQLHVIAREAAGTGNQVAGFHEETGSGGDSGSGGRNGDHD